ncbi:hypothetical protein CCR75_001549 [Bremia lactucae]|uniref:Beta-Casp domain-containing protein n=1 Tax=Bremia lactucae TaxID=4779 RepID=A0A976FE91_BRELC|nr:hypothetical protein CCR75_001549 [Bremia lactucae]
MSLSVERLGNGGAFCLREERTGVNVLIGCGEANNGAPDDSSVEDFEALTTQYRRDLKHLLRRDGGTLDAILVPDYRPGVCYLLPYMTEKCGVSWGSTATTAAQDLAPKRPPLIIMTHSTRAIAPHLLAEYWTGCHSKVKAVALKSCMTINEHLKVTAYHSGHVAGGCAFYLEIGATTVLFANDFNLTGGRVLLPAIIPRLEPTAMITRSSFAVTVSETQSAMERELVKVISDCIGSDGKVVIPIYRVGYFHDLLTILLERLQQIENATGKAAKCPIYLSDAAMEYPSRFLPLLSRTCTPTIKNLLREKNPHALNLQAFDWKLLHQPGPFVLFTGPANISQGDSLRALKAIASEPKNLIVLSEYCTPGTINYSLYADPARKRVSKRLGVSVECGVHYQPCGDEVDAKSIVQLVSCVAPSQVILDFTAAENLKFVKTHVQNHLMMDPAIDPSVVVKGMSSAGRTSIETARDIPLRIHKSMFNNPSDIQGMLIAEPKRKLMLVSSGNGARRLKKKKHALFFSFSWKKPFEPSARGKRKSPRPASALSFLLSAAAESADEEDESEQQPHADVDKILKALENSLKKWLFDFTIEKIDRWLKLRTVGVSVSAEWEVHMEWSFDDEALAGRVLGIAKHIVNAEYQKQLAT